MQSLKELLHDFTRHNNLIADFNEETDGHHQDGNDLIPMLADKLVESHYNPALGSGFADVIQNTDFVSNGEQFSPQHLQDLYASLLRLQEYNLETWVDAAYFELTVLRDAAKAEELALAAIGKANQKIEALQRLLDTISKG